MRKLFLSVVLAAVAAGLSGQEGLVYKPDYVPPPCEGIYVDTPCPGSTYVPWAEQLFREGITVGTQLPGDPLAFSPDLPIPREQTAVWVLRAEHSILERFAVGQVTCPTEQWAKCSATEYNDRIHADSVVMMTYRTRGDDTQIPARVVSIFDGGFSFEIQTGQKADYLAYVANEFPVGD